MGERALVKCTSIILIADWSYTSTIGVRLKTIMIIFNFFFIFLWDFKCYYITNVNLIGSFRTHAKCLRSTDNESESDYGHYQPDKHKI